MKQAFALPTTPTSRVTYIQRHFQGNPCVPYMTSAIITTPKSNDHFFDVMRARQTGPTDIKSIVGIEPPREFQRQYAEHKAARYATAAEH